MVKTTEGEKEGTLSKGVKNVYVNQRKNSLKSPLLWKNLWTMWKTMSYQQVFRFFGFFNSPVENLHIRMHTRGVCWFFPMLRHRVKGNGSIKKQSKKFTNCKFPVSYFVTICNLPK